MDKKLRKKQDWKSFKEELLSDPATRAEYDALEDEFHLISVLLGARLDRKMSQAELAKKTGMKQTAIARLESGQANPTYATLSRVAKALDKKVTLV